MPDARARRGGRLEVVVGHESELFQDQDQAQLGDAHLALSLILLPPSLPEAPDPSVAREVKPEERASLDLAFDDEEQFGLWLAALRALVAEEHDLALESESSGSAGGESSGSEEKPSRAIGGGSLQGPRG